MGSPASNVTSNLGRATASFASQSKLSQHALILCQQSDHYELQPNDHEPPRCLENPNTRIPLRSSASAVCVCCPVLVHPNERLHLGRRIVVVVVYCGNVLVLVLWLHHGELKKRMTPGRWVETSKRKEENVSTAKEHQAAWRTAVYVSSRASVYHRDLQPHLFDILPSLKCRRPGGDVQARNRHTKRKLVSRMPRLTPASLVCPLETGDQSSRVRR